MTPWFADDSVTVYAGDCLEVLAEIADASVDAVVTDPPYSLGFMGAEWDTHEPGQFQQWCASWAHECLRVLRPGGHLLAFGGARTWHRLACAIEDAGFELRDSIAWLYGNGFPKSLDVAKAIDRQRDDRVDVLRVTGWLRAQRDRAGVTNRQMDALFGFDGMANHWVAQPNNKVAEVPTWEQWGKLRQLIGFGDAMDAEVRRLNGRKGTPGEAWIQRPDAEHRTRPGMAESWTDGRGWTGTSAKDGTAVTASARRWEGWGTALKPAHEPIVVARKPLAGTVAQNVTEHGTGALNIDGCRIDGRERTEYGLAAARRSKVSTYGNPSESADFDASKGRWPPNVVLDVASAAGLDGARFFYTAKAAANERPEVDGVRHPTVKPLSLMRWLVRLVTPPGGVVLDPFAGSGTTAEACVLERKRCIAIEREATYLPLIRARLSKPIVLGLDFDGAELSKEVP
ncbi:DNA-methyltransferase [Nocardia sp. N2S4-5]|uniref:DNA-methyltransferase n=1 Tax=Nocardia sp. N2S4-5 TaxID=3351565 RepID=UPI0037D88A4B